MFGTEVAGGAQTELPTKCDWNIFRFDYFYLHFIIMDDQMQLSVLK